MASISLLPTVTFRNFPLAQVRVDSKANKKKPPIRKTKLRKKMKKNWGKMRENIGKWGKIDKILSCPPRGERLATVQVDALTHTCIQLYESMVHYQLAKFYANVCTFSLFDSMHDSVLLSTFHAFYNRDLFFFLFFLYLFHVPCLPCFGALPRLEILKLIFFF